MPRLLSLVSCAPSFPIYAQEQPVIYSSRPTAGETPCAAGKKRRAGTEGNQRNRTGSGALASLGLQPRSPRTKRVGKRQGQNSQLLDQRLHNHILSALEEKSMECACFALAWVQTAALGKTLYVQDGETSRGAARENCACEASATERDKQAGTAAETSWPNLPSQEPR